MKNWLIDALARMSCWVFGHCWSFISEDIPSGKTYRECGICGARRRLKKGA